MPSPRNASGLSTKTGTFGREPETVFVAHGEPEASEALARAIRKELGWTAVVPRLFERVSLG